MKKSTNSVGMFLYRVSGVERLVSSIQTKILNYKLRLRMIPVSYKLFISILNVVIGASGMYVYIESPRAVQDILGHDTVIIENVQAKEKKYEEKVEWNKSIFTSYSIGDGYTPSDTTASGEKVHVGGIACPRDIKLGTQIEVEGIGTFVCNDRKAISHDGEFDIYSQTVKEAIKFGVKTLNWRIWNK